METSITPLLGWRDYLHVRADKIRGDAEYYCSRAAELRDLIEKILTQGFTDAAEISLADLAEGDMVDFCIMVDLAQEVDVPNVPNLRQDDCHLLHRFLELEPWRSLVVDTHITVCIAMLRSYGENEEETIWYQGDPHLMKSISVVFEAVDREQLGHLVAEINYMYTQKHIQWDTELCAITTACCERAATRLGIQAPVLFN